MRLPSAITGNPVGGQPLYRTAEEMRRAIEDYFNSCGTKVVKDEEGNVLMDAKGVPVVREEPPTVTGLALALGFTSRQSLTDYRRRREFSDLIKTAVSVVSEYHERNLSVRDKCTGDIFYLKNHGWYDSKQVTVNTPVDETKLKKAFAKAKPEADAQRQEDGYGQA